MNTVQIPAGARLVAEGLGFVEGPVATAGAVLVTSINRGHVYRVPLDGTAPELLVETGGGPNGLAIGGGGELWITQNGATAMPSKSIVDAMPSLQCFRDGVLETVLDQGVDSPSDCVWGPDGALWFTDPPDHTVDGIPRPGRLLSYDGTLHTQVLGLLFPNGLAFTASGEIYVAETSPGRVRRYRRTEHGCVPDGWEVVLPQGKPDGIAVDVEGWLWIATSFGNEVVAVDADGRIRERVFFGDGVLVTSVCFAGADLRTLVVTIARGGTVVALPAPHAGLEVHGGFR